MKNKKLEIASLVIQLIYGALCGVEIVLCLVLQRGCDPDFERSLAFFVLDYTGFLLLLPAMPVGLILNICALRKRRQEGIPRKGWIIWTVLSPVMYILCFLTAIVFFVAATGGV